MLDRDGLIQRTEDFFAAYNAHEVDSMVAMCAPSMALNYVPEGENGKGDRQTAHAIWSTFTKLMPDHKVNVQRILAGDQFVVAETNKAEHWLRTSAPSSRKAIRPWPRIASSFNFSAMG